MSDETYLGWHVTWIEEWSQFVQACNWYTFRVIHFEVEDDRCMGGVEATFVLLGLGLRIRWNYAETEHLHEIRRRVEEIDLEDFK